MLSVQFVVGQRTAKLTIPSSLAENDYLTLFVDVPPLSLGGTSGEELFIEFDAGRAPFSNGAVLNSARKKGRRLTFAVVSGAGTPVLPARVKWISSRSRV